MQYVVNKYLIKQLDGAVDTIKTLQLEEEGKPGGADPARDYIRELERIVKVFITSSAEALKAYGKQQEEE